VVPPDYWDSSLIFLVNPNDGTMFNQTSLAGGDEWYLAAVVGNRGDTDAGRYINDGLATGPQVLTAAFVMVFSTAVSPAVQLPSLSNLDVNDNSGTNEVYFLKQQPPAQHQYEIVGFRLNVQNVFDGLVKATNQAVADGKLNLGGFSTVDWLKSGPGAHLCAKVVIKQPPDPFPTLGDTPFTDKRIAQKNLVPFKGDLAVVSPDPNIIWEYFTVGQPLHFLRFDPGLGINRLTLDARLPEEAFRLYVGMPRQAFDQKLNRDAIRGFKLLPEETCLERGLPRPFPESVILELVEKENALEIPALAEGEFVAMALGIEYSVKRLKAGHLGKITMVHRQTTPKVDLKRRCYEIEHTTVGGFTIPVEFIDSREALKPPKR
jgi:hypothetical protein